MRSFQDTNELLRGPGILEEHPAGKNWSFEFWRRLQESWRIMDSIPRILEDFPGFFEGFFQILSGSSRFVQGPERSRKTHLSLSPPQPVRGECSSRNWSRDPFPREPNLPETIVMEMEHHQQLFPVEGGGVTEVHMSEGFVCV